MSDGDGKKEPATQGSGQGLSVTGEEAGSKILKVGTPWCAGEDRQVAGWLILGHEGPTV